MARADAPLVAVLAAFSLVACERQPDELVAVYGRLTGDDGGAIEGARVTLRQTWRSCAPSFAPLPEVPDRAPPPSELIDESTTTADGAWALELAQARTEDRCFEIDAPGSTGRGRALALLALGGFDGQLPDLPAWSSAPSVQEVTGGLEVSAPVLAMLPGFDPRYPSSDPSANHVEVLTLRVAATLVARSSTTPSLWRVSRELLEDFGPVDVRIEAAAFVQGTIELVTGRALESMSVLQGPPVRLSPSFERVVPLTRGAACALDDGPPAPCRLTDGLLEPVWLERDGRPLTRVVLHLDGPRRPRMIVLRGLRGEVRVEGLPVGSAQWRDVLAGASLSPPLEDPAGSAQKLWGEAALVGALAPADVWLVKLEGSISMLAEVSVFE